MAWLQMVKERAGFILGEETRLLERQAAAYAGAERCVLVERAADGISLALGVCGIGEGDEVLCTAFGSASTLGAIRRLGAKPVFVDINPNTLTIDPYCMDYVIRKKLREKKPIPRALVAADLFGLPCNYEALSELCGKHGIDLVEDMAGAFAAEIGGSKAGSFGRFAVASFFDRGSAGGFEPDGAIFCRDGEDADVLEVLRGDGAVQQVLGGEKHDYREDEVQSTLLGKKLECFDGEAGRRRMVAGWYRDRLRGVTRVQEPPEGYTSACTHFAVSLGDGEQRERVRASLTRNRIPSAIYCPMPLHKRMRGCPGGDAWERVILVNAERASARTLLLPMHPYLSENVVAYICQCVEVAVKG